MKSCVFFGHRNLNVEKYGEKIKNIVTELIEREGVTQFYSGYRGDFEVFCANLVREVKIRYPQIKNTMALSYIPKSHGDREYSFTLPQCFDDSVYLLQRRVPQRLAIIETNKRLVDLSDFIVSAIMIHGGGAFAACEYAYKRKKPVINVIDTETVTD